MPTAQIQVLIDKQDAREIIRDQVAAILKVESDSQMALATAADKDPSLWKLRVYSERSDPWAAFDDTPERRVPLVNVWIETSTYDKAASNSIEQQRASTVVHIDCLGYGVAEDTEAGHRAADKMALLEAERAARLARNILMSSYYTYLGFPQASTFTPEQRAAGQKQVVLGRWPTSLTPFQPTQNDRPVERVMGIRFDLDVSHNEFSPQYVPEVLETIAATLTRTPEGEWISLEYSVPENP